MFDYDGAEPTFKDGVLTIRLPKLESKKVRKLEITAACCLLILREKKQVTETARRPSGRRSFF